MVKVKIDIFSVSVGINEIKFYIKSYRQIVGIPMGTNCAPLVADLFYSATKEIS